MANLNGGSDTKSSHYSQSFNPELMKAWAKKAAWAVNFKKNEDFPGNRIVLVYTGMSGVAHGMYLSAALHRNNVKHEHLYVRKAHEKSHGRKVESSLFDDYRNNKYVLVFVDDYIFGGTTRKSCITTVFADTSMKENKIKFSGLITCTFKAPHPVTMTLAVVKDHFRIK